MLEHFITLEAKQRSRGPFLHTALDFKAFVPPPAQNLKKKHKKKTLTCVLPLRRPLPVKESNFVSVVGVLVHSVGFVWVSCQYVCFFAVGALASCLVMVGLLLLTWLFHHAEPPLFPAHIHPQIH